MPAGATLATTTSGGTAQTTRGSTAQAAPIAVVPFIRASQEHREAAVDVSRQATLSDQDMGAFPIPAYGYLRSLIILVQATGGVYSVAGTVAADSPFSAIKNITLSEPNGAVIYQANSGYDAMLIMKYGGYRYCQDPRISPAFVASSTAGNFAFLLRVPLEINLRDSLGSLPNQNAAATFILRMTLAGSASVVTGGTITTQPTVRVRVWNEEWDQPELAGEAGQNQTTPPAMNTTQYWSVQQYPLSAGTINVRLTRMGNYIRNLIFMYRDASGVRVSQIAANWPNPATLYWDTRPQDVLEINNWMQQVYERYSYSTWSPGGTAIPFDAAGGLDTGIMPYDFAHEFNGQVGRENRDLWLPTLGSTRLELGGTWGTAGTLYVLTNDVSVAGDVFL